MTKTVDIHSIAAELAEVLGDAVGEVEFSALCDRVAAARSVQALAEFEPVSIVTNGAGGTIETYSDGSYVLKPAGQLA